MQCVHGVHTREKCETCEQERDAVTRPLDRLIMLGELSRAIHSARLSRGGLGEYVYVRTDVLLAALFNLQAKFIPWCDWNPITNDFALFERKPGDCPNRAVVMARNCEVWLCEDCASLPEWSGYKKHPLSA